MDPYRQQLDDFYRARRGRLFACALAVTRCPEAAEDAVHEVFCHLAARPVQARNLEAFVMRAVRNAAIDQLRRRGRRAAPLDGSIFDPSPGPDRLAGDREFREQVAAALDRLGDDERETIVLHLWGDLTFREIAVLRQSPMGTVVSWYRRGLERLRESMQEAR